MDEQVILNTGLMNANVTWKTTTRLSKACSVRDGWEGHGRDNISVHVFSQRMICRSECCGKITSKDFFAVWHTQSWQRRLREGKEVVFIITQ